MQGRGPVEIDEATDRRLRWMVHKRVLVRVHASGYTVTGLITVALQVVMVVTYFAQTLDKG